MCALLPFSLSCMREGVERTTSSSGLHHSFLFLICFKILAVNKLSKTNHSFLYSLYRHLTDYLVPYNPPCPLRSLEGTLLTVLPLTEVRGVAGPSSLHLQRVQVGLPHEFRETLGCWNPRVPDAWLTWANYIWLT